MSSTGPVPIVQPSLNQELSVATSFEELAAMSVRACARAVRAQICTLWRVYVDEENKRRLRLAAAYGVEAPRTLAQDVTYAITPGAGAYDGITGYVASEKKPVLVNSFEELRTDYAFCWKGKMDVIQWKGNPQKLLRNLYAFPLCLGEELQGVLKVENLESGQSLIRKDVAVVDELAREMAIVAKTLVLLDSHARQLIEAPTRLSEALVRPFETDKLAQDIVDTTAKTLNAQVCSLWLVDHTGRRLEHQASFGFKGPKSEVPPYQIDTELKSDADVNGITAWVAIRRRPFWANSHEELRKHPSWRGQWDPVMYGGREEAASRFHSMYAVPLVWNTELLGVLKVENPLNARSFSLNDRRLCDLLANYIVLLLVLAQQVRLQLVPGMAHILNSPTAALATMLDQLSREIVKTRPDLARVKTYVDLAKRYTLTIADMSRTLSAEIAARVGHQEIEQEDLVELLEGQLSKIEPLLPEGLTVKLKAEIGKLHLPLTRSERVWFEVVVFNLLHNAIKYSPDGGLIELTCARESDEIVLTVTDQGKGVPHQDRPHIFKPHWVGEQPQGWPEGTGLGLYEVRRLLDQFRWTITVGDNQPHGARFEVHIPAQWRVENA